MQTKKILVLHLSTALDDPCSGLDAYRKRANAEGFPVHPIHAHVQDSFAALPSVDLVVCSDPLRQVLAGVVDAQARAQR